MRCGGLDVLQSFPRSICYMCDDSHTTGRIVSFAALLKSVMFGDATHEKYT